VEQDRTSAVLAHCHELARDALVDLATIVSLIGSTHSLAGLRVRSELDRGEYPAGVTVTEAQMATVRLERHRFHRDWNYTIHPASSTCSKSVVS
jgi:hypothetical protein